MNRILSFNYFLQNYLIFSTLLFSQNNIELNSYFSTEDIHFRQRNKILNRSHLSSGLNLSFHANYISNSGHPNIDNNAEIFAPGTNTNLLSARIEYDLPWLSLSLEPYTISYNSNFNNAPAPGTYNAINNHLLNNSSGKIETGFRQSSLILHYNGIGIGYGNMSHWWGPGFHSALALTTNAPSQKTYSLGTFEKIRIGDFSFYSKLLAMPYLSNDMNQIYFTGLKSSISYHSKSSVITLGFHRTFLSGDFSTLNESTISVKSWSIFDASRLVFEPLFGQSKKNLSYTAPGTPGFDIWDQLLTGFAEIYFNDIDLRLYLDIASDDNRGNFTDLRAHWDHTLGYQIGLTKNTKYKRHNLYYGIEYLTTRVSNTYNPKFYRGDPNSTIYYYMGIYDYFTYQGRRMGAHSGSSADDLIFILGFSNDISTTLMSYNKERHGIKSMTYPELKTEYVLTYHRKMSQHHTAFITLEYEKIKNFGFIQNNISVSKLIWLGYSFSIN